MTLTERAAQMIAIRLSLAIGCLMLAAKWYAFAITGSAAILSDAAESVVHIAAVAFAAFSLWLSFRPPDPSHPYGHDRITFFSAGMEGGFIILAASYIFYESISKLLSPFALTNLDTGTIFIVGASVVNLGLGLFLLRTGRRHGSLILVANGKHVLTDSWTSFGVVAGLGVTMATGWLLWDPLIAMAVAANIVWSGARLVRQSVGGLMDEGSPALEQTIRALLQRETAARGLRYHELRYRRSGMTTWIEFHLLFPPQTLLEEAHRTATSIEAELTRSCPGPVRIVSHMEVLEEHDASHAPILKH